MRPVMLFRKSIGLNINRLGGASSYKPALFQ
jgi:hypothetical protein